MQFTHTHKCYLADLYLYVQTSKISRGLDAKNIRTIPQLHVSSTIKFETRFPLLLAALFEKERLLSC